MFYEDRPKLKLEKTTTEYLMEYTTFGLLAFSFVYAFYNYSSLPEEIPMHFNYSGEVTRYGNKDSIWALLIIGAATVALMYYLNKSPHIFNYAKKITLENAKEYYTGATKIMRYLNLGIALLFSLISYEIITVALDGTKRFSVISNYIIIAIVVTMALFPLVYLIKSSGKKK